MKYFGTKNNKDYGFYETNFENAIPITDEYWVELLNEQTLGKRIIPYNENVIAVDENNYEFINGTWKKLTEKEAQAQQLKIQNAIKVKELQVQMAELDIKRIRALAEPSLKDEETTWLEFYTNKISELRKELDKISD